MKNYRKFSPLQNSSTAPLCSGSHKLSEHRKLVWRKLVVSRRNSLTIYKSLLLQNVLELSTFLKLQPTTHLTLSTSLSMTCFKHWIDIERNLMNSSFKLSLCHSKTFLPKLLSIQNLKSFFFREILVKFLWNEKWFIQQRNLRQKNETQGQFQSEKMNISIKKVCDLYYKSNVILINLSLWMGMSQM